MNTVLLDQILGHIHNWFDRDRINDDWTIENGTISLSFLSEGQYFRIVGSVFNDGVHVYPATDLRDETFTGEIWVMAIPPAFISLAEEITDWQEKYGELACNPYQSESFGGYSYNKGVTLVTTDGSDVTGWRAAFHNQLSIWRKLPCL